MIGLPDDWDGDLYEEVPHLADLVLASFGDEAMPAARPSKATELLQRVSEICSSAHRCDAADDELAAAEVAMDIEPPCDMQAPAGPPGRSSRHLGAGVFGDAAPPGGGDADVAKWAAKAPTLLGSSFSFRGSMRGGLLAVPCSDGGGGHRVRLMRLEPHLLRSRPAVAEEQGDFSRGLDLLGAQVASGFSRTELQPGSNQPKQQVPVGEKVGAFISEALKAASREGAEADAYCQETMQLLSNFYQDQGAGGGAAAETGKPGKRARTQARKSQRLSSWLSRVNAKKVKQYLAKQQADSASAFGIRASLPTETPEARLKRVLHLLSANAVRTALEELAIVSKTAPGETAMYFDRLAALIASGGGVSSTCIGRRQFLQHQLQQWRRQEAGELMGAPLWSLYNLLGGELGEVVGEFIDWRTAFAAFLWYRCPSPEESLTEHDRLRAAVAGYEAQPSTSCCFQPLPPYCRPDNAIKGPLQIAAAAADAKSKAAPRDLQYNVIRAALGLSEWSDLRLLDYHTHTACPLNVAQSWHVASVLFAAHGGDTAERGFQQMTQQYCFLLELAGEFGWAIYVAQYLIDDRARALATRGLMLRAAAAAPSGGGAVHAGPGEVKEAVERLGVQLPAVWWWRCQAVQKEAAQDWPAAAVGWLRSGEPERALAIALGHVLGAVLAAHSAAPYTRGASETVLLSPMAAQAQWLLAVLEEAAPRMSGRTGAVAEACMDALSFMRDWEHSQSRTYDAVTLSRLRWRSDALRHCRLGCPR